MANGSQYGEDTILQEFFKDQQYGIVVDVGAADGFDNSNSYELLKRPNWTGLLIEPEITQFEKLKNRYQNNSRIKCLNCAIGKESGTQKFYTCLQVSTLKEYWKKNCESTYNVTYGETLVNVNTLTNVLFSWFQEFYSIGILPEIDFLTIDCEGTDFEVLQSLDLRIFRPRLICLECATNIPGYKELIKTTGNTLYVRAN